MKNFYCNCRLLWWLACLMTGFGLLSCSDSESGGRSEHQPDQPIELESFSPKTGPIATQVIIKGKNFGTRVEDISVSFNEKRAAVTSSFNTPVGLAIDSEGILYVNDSENYAIRRIATE